MDSRELERVAANRERKLKRAHVRRYLVSVETHRNVLGHSIRELREYARETLR